MNKDSFYQLFILKFGQYCKLMLPRARPPKGVTTIDGFHSWDGNLPTKGGNNFIILEQFDRDCGPTSVEMVLHYYGYPGISQGAIWKKGDIHTIHVGTFPSELKQALDGLKVPVDWFVGANYSALKQYISQNKPCIILLQKGLKAYHWVVVVGYDNRDRFLIADPNGYFEWWGKHKLDSYWSFRNGSTRGLKSDFINATIRQFADPYTWIVPKKGPDWQNWRTNIRSPRPPNSVWSQMRETEVTGSRKLNPLFKTERWERTFRFTARPGFYKVAGMKPSQIGSAGGTAQAWISGSKIEGNTVKVWGEIEYGRATRGKLWVVVRAYRNTDIDLEKQLLIDPF